jgi:hypothetical protein
VPRFRRIVVHILVTIEGVEENLREVVLDVSG